MSLPVSYSLLSFSGRRNRQSFVLAYAILLVVWTIMAMVIFLAFLLSAGGVPSYYDMTSALGTAFLLLGFLFSIPVAICQVCITAQRLRDLNLSGWYVLLLFGLSLVPFVNFIAPWVFFISLCVVAGTAGPNKYGDDMLQVYPAAPSYTSP